MDRIVNDLAFHFFPVAFPERRYFIRVANSNGNWHFALLGRFPRRLIC
jgi:hypothetical protein